MLLIRTSEDVAQCSREAQNAAAISKPLRLELVSAAKTLNHFYAPLGKTLSVIATGRFNVCDQSMQLYRLYTTSFTLVDMIRRAFANMFSTRPSNDTLSPDQLRALSHSQLLNYALKHLSSGSISDMAETEVGRMKRPNEDMTVDAEKPKKRKREFNMNRYGQRLIALRLTYQGWRYHGFASQTTSENTVEHHLFAALMKTHLIKSRETCEYSRSGRTDVGVSAMGQVIGLRMRSNVAPPSFGTEELDYTKVINSTLPDGIRVLSWTPVSEGGNIRVFEGDPTAIRRYWSAVNDGTIKSDSEIRRPDQPFSARFDAVYRSYRYFFVRGHLDIPAMRRAARYFEGTHDFRNFCRIDENVSNFERLMYNVDVCSVSDENHESNMNQYAMYYIFVKGQAFLWHQVRCMAAVLFEIGMGREKPELVRSMLEDVKSKTGAFSNGRPHYRMASPTPLLLYECAYPRTVLFFPQMQGDLASAETRVRPSSLERADQKLAASFSEESAKSSILYAMLRENDTVLFREKDGAHFGSSLSSSGQISGTAGFYRNYLLDVNTVKHVPFSQRAKDITVEEKKARAAQKISAKKVDELHVKHSSRS